MGRGSVAQRLVDFVQSGRRLGARQPRRHHGRHRRRSSARSRARARRRSRPSARSWCRRCARAGYPETFTAGLITAVGAIDIIIPPSIPMIVYGAAAEESVPRLYAAGVLPGLLIAGMLAVYVIWRAQARRLRHGRAVRPQAVPARHRPQRVGARRAGHHSRRHLWRRVLADRGRRRRLRLRGASSRVRLPRAVGWRDIVEAAATTVLFTAQILIIVACAGVFAWLLTVNQVPATLTAWLQSLEHLALDAAARHQHPAAGGRLLPRSAVGDPAAQPAAGADGQGGRHRHRALRHRGDGQPRDRPVSPAVRHQHLRRADRCSG